MAESKAPTAPSAAKGSTSSKRTVSEGEIPSSNPPRQDTLPADAKADEPGAAALQGVIQERRDEANEKGHLGVKPNPTPNSHYTLEGVTSGKPTPETVVRQDTSSGLARGV